MLAESLITVEAWEKSFQKKFASFCAKSPVLLKMSVRIQDGSKGVLLEHVNSGKTYFFPFEYEMGVKDFIARIKHVLVINHYPRLVRSVYENHKKTNEELAEELEEGVSVDQLTASCMRCVGTQIYRIDKVLPWKNMAIITLEKSDIPGDEIGSTFRYSYQKSIVLYLKNYRSGHFDGIEEASEEFFNNSDLVSEILPKALREKRKVEAEDIDVETEESAEVEVEEETKETEAIVTKKDDGDVDNDSDSNGADSDSTIPADGAQSDPQPKE